MTLPFSRAAELKKTVGTALELSIAGAPYADVIGILGTMRDHQREFLMSGERVGIIDAASSLFTQICFSLDKVGTSSEARILTMEFCSVPGTYTFHDLREAFGEWRRTPREPDQVSFALAWFPSYDVRSGAPFSLYAEYEPYSTAIDPDQTPGRIYFQPQDGSWD